MTHLLTLDEFALDTAGQWFDTDRGYSVQTLAADADFGNPQPITSTLPSALEIGSQERITGWENRAMHFVVRFKSDTAAGLELAEADFAAACRGARELRWTPPAEDATLTVHDVQHAYIDAIFDDLDELDLIRAAHLRIAAMPFPRSDVEVVIPALGSGTGTSSPAPVVTPIYTGATTAGWTYRYGPSSTPGAVAAAPGGGVVNATSAPASGAFLRYGPAIAMGSDRWLVADVEYVGPAGASLPGLFCAWSGATRLVKPTVTIGTKMYFLLPAGGLTLTDVAAFWSSGFVTIRSISRQNRMPFASNTKQLIRSFEVPGSAPTEGSLAISHATAALGRLMVYSWPKDGSGYVPPIGAYLTSSTADAVTDTEAVLGRYLPVTTTASTHRVYEVPAGQLPEGSYTVCVRAKAGSSLGILTTVRASTVLGGQALSEQFIQQFVPLITEHRVQSIGKLTLPPAAVSRGSTAKVRITVGNATPGTELRLDEVYLLNTDSGEVTHLHCGTGTVGPGLASNRVWLDAPTVDRGYQTIWVGTQADRSDARHISGLASNPAYAHRWTNGTMNLLTVSDAYDVAAEGRCYPRWIQNAGAVD